MKKVKIDLKDHVGKFFLEGKNLGEISSILDIPIGKGNVKGTVKEYLRCWRVSRSSRGRVPWNKGIPWSEEVKKKLNKTQFKKGHKPWNTGEYRSEETKQKISKAHKGKLLLREHKRKISLGLKSSTKFKRAVKSKKRRSKISKKLKGRNFSKEWRKKISNSLKGLLIGEKNPAKHPQVREKISKALKKSWQDPDSGLNSPVRIKKLREKTLLQLKKNPIKISSAEVKLRDVLKKHNLNNFTPQFQALDRYLIDIAFPEEKLAIECDGYYWHNLPKRIERDKLRDKRLRNEGWEILRISDKNIHENIDQVVKRICSTLEVRVKHIK